MKVSDDPAQPVLRVEGVAKRFRLHHQNGALLSVLDGVDLCVYPGECVVLDGPSGTGKSTLLKLIYGNYRATAGSIMLSPGTSAQLEMTTATPRELIAARREDMGYVSQFLRVIPRIAALDVVAESLLERVPPDAIETADRLLERDHPSLQAARAEAARWLERLGIGRELWQLPPATFSGGEQQRINVARNLIKPCRLLLLDEPTASLDADNTRVVIELIGEARARGTAIVGVFHDPAACAEVATRRIKIECFRKSA